MLKIQSVRASLDEMDQSKIPNSEEIGECLASADLSLKEALGYSKPPIPATPPEKKKPD